MHSLLFEHCQSNFVLMSMDMDICMHEQKATFICKGQNC